MLRSFFRTLRPVSSDNAPIQFITGRKAILDVLRKAKNMDGLVGIYSKVLGEGMFLVGVEEIVKGEAGLFAVFTPYDQCGRLLIRNSIDLAEIEMVCHLERPYVNPVLHPKRTCTLA